MSKQNDTNTAPAKPQANSENTSAQPQVSVEQFNQLQAQLKAVQEQLAKAEMAKTANKLSQDEAYDKVLKEAEANKPAPHLEVVVEVNSNGGFNVQYQVPEGGGY
jgi:predicted transcriptional regulator